MRLAIMQPYFFPYLGYYQLVASTDRFVFYDDVNYIKNSWINRNRLLHNGAPHYFTVPLQNASPNRKIRDVSIAPQPQWQRKMLARFHHAYRRAPHFDSAYALLERVVTQPCEHIGDLAKASITFICDALDVAVDFVPTSTAYGNQDLRAQDRVLDICAREQASEYVNLPSGRSLYQAGPFAERGVALLFLVPYLRAYRQGNAPFCPGLSILDVLMHNDRLATRAMLHEGTVAP